MACHVQGMDPNFHDDSGGGETPLTVAATIDAVDVIVALVEVCFFPQFLYFRAISLCLH